MGGVGKENCMKELLLQYWTWFKIGLFTFGGGYAMLPLIEKEVVEKYHWATREEIMDYYAIGQSTPGIIALNTATFIGYGRAGIPGAILATLGVISPSILLITVIATLLSNFQDIPVIGYALTGIQIGVCMLMTVSIMDLWKSSVKDKVGIFICLITFVLSYFMGLGTVVLIILAVASGIVIKTILEKREMDDK